VTRDKLDILRKADAVFLEEIRNAGLYDAIWQAFAVLFAGENRRRDGRCALLRIRLRAARRHLDDGMTADYYPFPHEILCGGLSDA